MTLHQIIAASALGGSVLLFFLLLILPIFSGPRRRFIRIGTALYISGTGIVFLIAMLRPAIPPNFVYLSEIFIFGIYIFTCGLILFVTKKFKQEPGSPSANDDSEEKS